MKELLSKIQQLIFGNETEGKRVAHPKGRFLPSWTITLMPLTFVFLELLLAALSGFDFTVYTLWGVLASSVGFGAILSMICSLPKSEAAGRWLRFSITEIATVIFLIEYFSNDSYYVFMSIESITTGAGDVVTNLGDIILQIIWSGMGIILLFHIPAFLFLYLCLRKKGNFKNRPEASFLSLLVAAALCFGGAKLMQLTDFTADKYGCNYVFDDSVRTFGLVKSLSLDVRYMVTGVPVRETPEEDLPPEPVEEPDPGPEEKTYASHLFDIDWKELSSELANRKNLENAATQFQRSDFTTENDYTGLLKGKNLVLITVESFSKELVREDFFPLVYRMATKGIVVEDYYHPFWGGSTSSGEAAILTGLIPLDGANTIQNTIGKDNSYTLAPMLEEQGYSCVAYHNGDYDYYDRYKTHPGLGFSQFISVGTGMEGKVRFDWPRSDEDMFAFIAEDLQQYDKFYAYVMTFSGHGVYGWGNDVAKKNRELLKDTEYYNDRRVGAYIAGSMDLELGLEKLVASLEERDVLEDTVFVLTCDHYPYALCEGEAWNNEEDYLAQLYGYTANTAVKRDHNALIIWSPCLEEEDEPITVSGPTMAPDILPTLLNLFGIDYDSRLYAGRDILSDAQRLVIWSNSSWLTEKGYYNAGNGKFTPAEGAEVPDDYVDGIKTIVSRRIGISKYAIKEDFYRYLNKYRGVDLLE